MKAHLDAACPPKSFQKERRHSTKEIELENEIADSEDKRKSMLDMDLVENEAITPTIPCRH